MPDWGSLASMAGKALGGKKKEKAADGGASGAGADWGKVGATLKQATKDGKVSNKELGNIAKEGYSQFSKDKKDGNAAPDAQKIGKGIVTGFFKGK